VNQVPSDIPLLSLAGRLREFFAAAGLLDRDAIALDEIALRRQLDPARCLLNFTGGLLGQAICVRSSRLPSQAEAFAKIRKLHLVYKDEMKFRLESILEE
jgi:hypothetical protein